MTYVVIFQLFFFAVLLDIYLQGLFLCLVKKLEHECDYIELINYIVYNYSLVAF